MAIKEAKENMGDFKLKTASDYVVPDHMRMNTDKARSRLVDIEEKVRKGKRREWRRKANLEINVTEKIFGSLLVVLASQWIH